MNGIKLWCIVDTGLLKVIQWFVYLGIFAAAVVLILSVVDIIFAKAFNIGIPGVTNIVEELNVVIIFSTIAYVQLGNEHMRITLVDMYLSKTRKHILDLVSHFLGIIVSGFFTWRTLVMLEKMIETHEYKSGGIVFPLWPFGLINFLGFLFLTIAFIRCFCKTAVAGSEK